MRLERKQKRYLMQDREMALLFFGVSREPSEAKKFVDAAKRANVAEKYVRLWVAGGYEGIVDTVLDTVEGETILATRPKPPDWLIDPDYETPVFSPAHDLEQWAREHIIEETGLLYNEDHMHLGTAKIGILWTNILNSPGGRMVGGTAEQCRAEGGIWGTGRMEFQMRGWFGEVPDFLITLYAPYAAEAPDASFCSLVEHEMYHCGHKRNRYGDLMFDKRTGNPVYGMRKHTVEEFWQVTQRYGIGASASGVKELIDVASRPPTIAEADIHAVCGTCHH